MWRERKDGGKVEMSVEVNTAKRGGRNTTSSSEFTQDCTSEVRTIRFIKYKDGR